MKTKKRTKIPTLSSVKAPAAVIALTMSLFAGLHGQVVFQDSFAYAGAGPGTLNGDININVPARQSGTTSTTYTPSFSNPVAGVTLALEDQSPALNSGADALFVRTQSGGSVGTVHSSTISLDSNFTSLSGTQWTFDYTARLTLGTAFSDVFLGFGFGSTSAPTGPGADGFFFALRDNGNWLLWNDGASGFNSGSLSGWTSQQEYSVSMLIDETGVNPAVSIAVTPLGGSAQTIVSSMALGGFGANRNFAFQSSAVSEASAGFTDARITGLGISIVPEPSQFGLILGALMMTLILSRRIR